MELIRSIKDLEIFTFKEFYGIFTRGLSSKYKLREIVYL